MNFEKCPNCNKNLKGFFASELIPQSKTDFINNSLELSSQAYCTSCSKPLIDEIARKFYKRKMDIENRLKSIIHLIPILSSPAPVSWEYEIIGMITAQTNSGTGFATELSQSFTDFFGGSSSATNRKIENATKLCKDNLRVQCVRNGGNAIISTDIDFNEIGTGNTHMLMVCMAGTAIKVLDMKNFNPKVRDTISEIVELTDQLEAISDLR